MFAGHPVPSRKSRAGDRAIAFGVRRHWVRAPCQRSRLSPRPSIRSARCRAQSGYDPRDRTMGRWEPPPSIGFIRTPPRKKRGSRRSKTRLGHDRVGSARNIGSLSRWSSRKRASRARWSISTRPALHHQRSGLNMIILHAATTFGRKPIPPEKWDASGESRVSRFTLVNFFDQPTDGAVHRYPSSSTI